MAHYLASLPQSRKAILLAAAAVMAALCAVLAGHLLSAQVDGNRGIAAVVSSSDIDVGGIDVDVRGDSAEDAREKGWRQAQRDGWAKLGGPKISDSQLQSMVSAIVIDKEQIGPRRYIARLGVIFDRSRASRFLGSSGQRARSAPMLLMPVTFSGGSQLVYERRNLWQRAWAEYQAGSSRIDYVRPSGAAGDSLLLTFGQTGRRSRIWWRNILDQFEAADVLVPIASLDYQWPGGPIDVTFTGRYGPDSTYLDSFTMTARGYSDLPRLYSEAVQRFDAMFEQGLADGKLRPNPTLTGGLTDADPALQRLIEAGRAADARDRAAQAAAEAAERGEQSTAPEAAPAPPSTDAAPVAVLSSYTIQFASPDAGTIDATLAAVRATAGVRGAATSSLAIGGTSVMSVTYGGSLSELAGALRARGFTVSQGAGALAISR
ncbi:heavy-metal-associated domain-containing protein [Pontixanthobacter sp.]|uniref:heavy-metal-associated domain-containing protein n=1 Tax=Pontixanthobacter sp. TaxID=2792078 RepID=UPI003C7D92FE